jgi:hypothetical protein
MPLVAEATFTRRQVVDMLPEFLTKRSAPFAPLGEAYAKELGLPRPALAGLSNALFFRDGDVVRRETYIWRSPYASKRSDIENQRWPEIVSAGLAEVVDGGWRLTPRAIEIGQDVGRRVRAQLRSFALPADAVRRAADVLEGLAARIPHDAERAARARRLRPRADEPQAAITRLNAAVYELWSFRDDCHVAAWRAVGYEGPVFDVLSQVWTSPTDVTWTKIGGHTTMEDLAKALEPRQDRADVERNVDVLVRRGDLARDGDALRLTPQGKASRDAIEEDTDRRHFGIWDLDDAATARLGEDLRAVIDAFPKA